MARLIGIVKWYGGYNSKTEKLNDFGYIGIQNGTDIRVHRTDLLCSEGAMREGKYVVFDIASQGRREVAKQVRPLEEEISHLVADEISEEALGLLVNILKQCPPSVVSTALLRVPPSLKTHPAILPFLSITERLSLLISNYRSSPEQNILAIVDVLHSNNQLIRMVPAELRDHPLLYPYLPLSEKLGRLVDTYQKSEQPEILDQIVTILQTDNLLFREVPAVLKDHPLVFPYLQPSEKLGRLIERYRKTEQPDALDQIVEILRSSSQLITIVPAELRDHPMLFPYLPLSEKLKRLVERYRSTSQPETFEQIVQLIASDRTLATGLPKDIKQLSPLVTYLSVGEQLDIYLEKYEHLRDKDSLKAIVEIIQTNPYLINKLTEDIKRNSALYSYLAPEDQIRVLLYHLESTTSRLQIDALIQQIAEIVTTETSLGAALPDAVKRDPRILVLLAPVEQVKLVWPSLEEEFSTLWQILSRSAKILCIFRAAKEDINLLIRNPEILSETDVLVQMALNILWAKYNPSGRDEVFKRMDDSIENYVEEQVWDSTEPIDLSPLLPSCCPGIVNYCEARAWPTDEDKKNRRPRVSRAYCSRLRGECGFYDGSACFDQQSATDSTYADQYAVNSASADDIPF